MSGVILVAFLSGWFGGTPGFYLDAQGIEHPLPTFAPTPTVQPTPYQCDGPIWPSLDQEGTVVRQWCVELLDHGQHWPPDFTFRLME